MTNPRWSELVGLVDMDGSIVDYDSAMKRDLARLAAPEETPYVSSGPDDNKPPHIEARMRLIRQTPGWWKGLAPIQQGIDVIHIMADLGYKVHILTKGPFTSTNAWTEKVEWCRHHLPKHVSVTITEDKGLVYGKSLLDDWPPYITRWLEWRPRGFVIMPTQPWNAGFEHPNVMRYDGSEEQKTILTAKLAMIRDTNLQKVYP